VYLQGRLKHEGRQEYVEYDVLGEWHGGEERVERQENPGDDKSHGVGHSKPACEDGYSTGDEEENQKPLKVYVYFHSYPF
jgi:hypothetical protein